MDRYLNKYLKENSKDELTKKYIDFFKIELDWFIYNYGEHISSTHNFRNKNNLRRKIGYIYREMYTSFYKPQRVNEGKNVLSSISLPDSYISKLEFNIFTTLFQPIGRKNIIGGKLTSEIYKKLNHILKYGNYNDLLNPNLYSYLEESQNIILNEFRKYNLNALFLYTDQYFYSKYLIDLFKKLDKPSLVFSHGLPGIYSKSVDNRSDYLMVWGEKIKENYINIAGFEPDKIHVVGNIKYKEVAKIKNLRNSLDEILVIPCSSVLWHQHEWDDPFLIDRSMIVLYLYKVQNVLQRLGVKKARFRPHPAINKEWVNSFIDNNFYKCDYDSLHNSLQKSSLIIGSTSSTFLEALMDGVNYIIFEPEDETGRLIRSKSVPPFDGSVSDLTIAGSEEELYKMLLDKYMVSPKILEGYMQPLDLSILKKIIP